MISSGTALIAAERMTMAKPVCIQIRITISHTLLNGDSWMKLTGLGTVSPSSVTTNPPTPEPT